MCFLNQDQVTQLLKVAKGNDNRNYSLFYNAITTGMRQGELLALKWENVDLKRGTLAVNYNLIRVPGAGLKLSPPKTNSSIRTIKLGTESVEVLKTQKQRLLLEKVKRNSLWKDSGHVFPSPIGSPMDPSTLLKQFRKALRKARLQKIRFHDLRHTAASLMLNNGVEILAVSQRLGHANPSITLDVYGHLLPSMQDKAAEMMDDLVST